MITDMGKVIPVEAMAAAVSITAADMQNNSEEEKRIDRNLRRTG